MGLSSSTERSLFLELSRGKNAPPVNKRGLYCTSGVAPTDTIVKNHAYLRIIVLTKATITSQSDMELELSNLELLHTCLVIEKCIYQPIRIKNLTTL